MNVTANNYILITLSLVLLIGAFIYYQEFLVFEEAPGIRANLIASDHN